MKDNFVSTNYVVFRGSSDMRQFLSVEAKMVEIFFHNECSLY